MVEFELKTVPTIDQFPFVYSQFPANAVDWFEMVEFELKTVPTFDQFPFVYSQFPAIAVGWFGMVDSNWKPSLRLTNFNSFIRNSPPLPLVGLEWLIRIGNRPYD